MQDISPVVGSSSQWWKLNGPKKWQYLLQPINSFYKGDGQPRPKQEAAWYS